MLKRLAVLCPALLLISSLTVASAATASKTPAKPARTASKPAVRPAIPAIDPKWVFAQASKAYAASQSASYTATLTYLSGPGKHTTLGITATEQKPNLLQAQISAGGNAVGAVTIGPTKGYIVDVPGKRYASFDTRSKYQSELQTAGVNGYKLIDGAGLYAVTLGTSIYSPSNFDLGAMAPPGALSTHASVATLRGKPVYHIVQSVVGDPSGMQIDTYLDKDTFVPVELSQTRKISGSAQIVVQLNFSMFTLSPSAADTAQFAYAPSATDTAYTAPAQENGEAPLMADGLSAPDFSVETLDGKTVKLSDYAGKVVVLDFWATWCQPCQMSLPLTDKIAAAYQPKGVVFLPICSWDAKAKFTPWVNARSTWAMHFYFDTSAEDQSKSIAVTKFNVLGIPTQYIVGKDGKIFTGFVGFDPDTTDLTQSLDRALAAT